MDVRRVSIMAWLDILLASLLLFPAPPGYGQEIQVTNKSSYQGSGRYSWTLYVLADDPIRDQIEYVEYILHPTFPEPIKRMYNKDQNFALHAEGWGAFEVKVRVHFYDGRDEYRTHMLQLR